MLVGGSFLWLCVVGVHTQVFVDATKFPRVRNRRRGPFFGVPDDTSVRGDRIEMATRHLALPRDEW